MTGDMAWETPPPPGHGYDWARIAQELRDNPNEWLRIFEEGPTSIVNAIRQSSITALTPISRPGWGHDGFEVRTRNNKVGPPRVCTLYMRYLTDNTGG